jgi:hypothetical protein
MDLLYKFNIKLLPLGGDIMNQIDLTVFLENYKVYAIVDRDPKSGKVRRKFKKKCEELKIPFYQLERYSIENYFSLQAIREIYKYEKKIPKNMKELDPKTPVECQLNFSPKKEGRKIAEIMTLDDIKKTDLYIEFLLNVKNLLENKN